ncbi:MAG: hypothetical protein OSA99_02765 [Acidimicrobiales bacterium]|nr:hypothetical protein [Acidimicrobiales bacterium]
MKPSSIVPLFLALALVASACGGDDAAVPSSAGDRGDSAATVADPLTAEVIEHYAAGAHASYEASLASATTMHETIDRFVADPSEDTLAVAKEAWLTARDDYGPTEVFRFYGGPIDNDDRGVEGLVNAWPMDEAYIDYVVGDPDAGIVNDPETYPTIDAEVLVSLNENGGETNISTGWHAIEFLLWGQDLSADGPGTRPASDYVEAPNADRRATYLAVASDLLLEHLTGLVEAWEPERDNFRADFVAESNQATALENIFTGAGLLAADELAGERMAVAYEARSQEDEHSCFSDNTTADIVGNANGVLMVVTGAYPGADGVGLADLVAATDTDLATRLVSDAEAGVAEAEAIPAPFDQHLTETAPDDGEGRRQLLTTIETLEREGETIVSAADAVGVDLEI